MNNILINYPNLTLVKKVQSFFGYINYDRNFILAYSKLILLLTALSKKNTKFSKTKKCHYIFKKLKIAFTLKSLLIYFNSDNKIVDKTDICDYRSAKIFFY